jgi:ubiquitin-like-specific protease 1C/D
MPMAAVSREKVPCGEAGVSSNAEKGEREWADAEVGHLPDRELQEKQQRVQGMLSGGIRLPDGGRKLRATLDAIQREQDRRQARGGMARATVSHFSSFVVISLHVRGVGLHVLLLLSSELMKKTLCERYLGEVWVYIFYCCFPPS